MGKKKRNKRQQQEQAVESPVAASISPKISSRSIPRWAIPVGLLAIAAIVYLIVTSMNGGQFDQTFEVLDTFPHNKSSYTQGLEWHRGFLFESAGQKGESGWGIVEHPGTERLYWWGLGKSYFGEGISILDDKLYFITYKKRTCFVYDLKPLGLDKLDPAKATKKDFDGKRAPRIATFDYKGDGWGLTNNGTHLIMSNGQPDGSIFFRDPSDFSIVKRLKIKDKSGKFLGGINELEWLDDGTLLANIYTKDEIVRIDLDKEQVISRIDMSGLLDDTARQSLDSGDVLNGIAHHPESGLFVTGKYWPHLFRIRLQDR